MGCLTLKMKAVLSFETSATICQSTRCNIPEDLNLHRQHSANYSVTVLAVSVFIITQVRAGTS